MYRLPGYRGRGIASLLVQHLVSWGKGRGALRVQLAADSGNKSAIDFTSVKDSLKAQ